MKIFTKNVVLIALLFCTFIAQAQKNGNVSGKIIDSKTKKPVDYASVVIKSLKDSSVVGSAVTLPTGAFEIKGLAPGNYTLFAAFLGYKTVSKAVTMGADKLNVNIGDVSLEDSGVTINEVEVVGEAPPIRVKKDTLEFSAGSFKVKENAVVEDVLKKLPGVDVDKSGAITAQGEAVKKVRVNGKDFMGSDPLLATRNLPADMIDKIQIIDDMSEQSKFSGIDDGNREKIINITTRQALKTNGIIGNNTVGYGTDDRYDVNLNVNRFNNNQQLSFIGQFNNVNKQNFGGGGGGGMRFTMGGGGGGGGNSGITTTNAAGINFADTYSDQTQFNGSYFFNKTNVFNTSNSYTQNLFGTNSTIVTNKATSDADRINHRFNFTVDTKLDSMTSIRIQPSISYTESDGLSTNVYRREVLTSTTEGSQKYKTTSQTPSFSNNLLIRKKFQRRGRTISLNMNTNINDNDGANYNNISDLITLGGVTNPNVIDQLNDAGSHTKSNNARIVYTEPLSKTLSLELNYQNNYSFDDSERLVYNFNPATLSYDLIDPNYTNTFENTTFGNSLGFSFNKVEKKYNWNVGLAVLNTDRKNVNVNTGAVFNQNFYNLTPSAQFRYTFSQNKRLDINYRGTTQQPTISQIQPIPDNTNTQTVYLGNPNLRPSFSNNLRINYRDFNFNTFRNFFVFANLSQTFNDFANSQVLITDPTDQNFGKIVNNYVNVKGNYSAMLFFNVGQPIVKDNKLTLSLGGGANYSKQHGFSNGIASVNDNLGLSGSLKLVSNMDKLDLTGGINVRYDNSILSGPPETVSNVYTVTPNIDVSYLFPGNIRLQADLFYNSVTGRGANFDTNYTLINSFISKQFFKNKGTFKISVNDLLNQNTGILRSATANQIQDMTFNVLKRYYMFSFTYSLGNIPGRSGAPGMGMGRGFQRAH